MKSVKKEKESYIELAIEDFSALVAEPPCDEPDFENPENNTFRLWVHTKLGFRTVERIICVLGDGLASKDAKPKNGLLS